ncbi:MAG: hypothetical protein U0527_10440 [Candidatus Eisenbacteria bacterium]
MTRPAPLRYGDWLKGNWLERVEREGTAPALLLAGPETLLRDQAIAMIRERAGSGVDVDRFWASETPLGDVAAALGSTGLFATRRIVILLEAERAGRAASAEKEALQRGLAGGHPDTVFVAVTELTAREFGRKNEWSARLAELCQVVELWHPRADEALRWLLEECRRRPVKLSPSSAQALLQAIGPDLQELSRELEKIELFLRDSSLEGEDILTLLRKGRAATVWDLVNAWTSGQTSEGLRDWDVLAESEPVLRVQWLLQQKSREALAARGSDPRVNSLALRVYELERAIKTGRIPGNQERFALECAVLGADLGRPGNRREGK